MSTLTRAVNEDAADESAGEGEVHLRKALSPNKIGAAYAVLAMGVFFSLFADGFFSAGTLTSILNEQSVTIIIAVGLTIPLAAGVFDLSIHGSMGLAAVGVSQLMVIFGLPPVAAVLMMLVVAVPIGLINGLLVVKGKIHPLIATLGIGSVLIGAVYWVSGNRNVTGLPEDFRLIATPQLFGLTLPVLMVVVLCMATWYVLDKTVIGRRLHATGSDAEVARLAGVPTDRIIVGSFIASSLVAMAAGIVVTARLGSGSPSVGPTYLLPAFAAAFLGATQFRPGRFNVPGTVTAVILLAVGVKGLVLMGAEFWVRDIFNGAALVLAVGISSAQARRSG